MYNRYVVFREVERKSESRVMVQTKNNPEKARFELRSKEEYDSYELTKLDEDVEQPTPIIRRY